MEKDVVRTEISEKRLDAAGILHVKILPGTVITSQNAKADMAVDLDITGGKNIRVLYDSRARFRVTLDTWEYFQEILGRERYVGVAVVTHNHGLKGMIKFIQQADNELPPIRVFPSVDKAEAWLTTLVS